MSRASLPATRDQVDGYRYGMRRLEAALVRGDPVPLHEQVRSQRRAAGGSVALGALAVAACLLVALISPKPLWQRSAVVVGQQSGAMYVVARDPDRLVPVTDLLAARLVIAALARSGAAPTDPATAEPVVVPDDGIADAPRTAAANVPGALATRPDVSIEPRWALCDAVDLDGRLVATTVLAGPLPQPPAPGPVDDAGLLRDPGGRLWLVADGRRHQIDSTDARVLATLDRSRARQASAALVDAIPEGAPYRVPPVPGRGRPGPSGLDAAVGDVLVTHTADGQDRYLVTFTDGVQEIPLGIATLLLDGAPARETTLAAIGAAGSVHRLPVDQWPSRPFRFPSPTDLPVTCWTWHPDRPVGTARTTTTLPMPTGTAVAVTLAQSDGPGPAIDAAVVGAGGAVRGTAPDRLGTDGPIWLVSASGVTHGVADQPTAAALGVQDTHPAPERLLRLLPGGPTLSRPDAVTLVDVPQPG
ncbi:type VII secretion protein EccB [Pseudonocardia thermophila]|uniref:Type VII secretion protein EccB n=1 Tax=Pseudonocardia thermophila TaxID=1848 RepID=A0A1M6X538_PSETH|nr:type VII secretion protein EccB [Pseudonocardia thermophila]SHL00959.1 type VII secretion protein EccB [Pseudonocardia thermophila]